MHGTQLRDYFLKAAEPWLCDGYGLDVRYVALATPYGWKIAEASLTLWPKLREIDGDFIVRTDRVVAERKQVSSIDTEIARQVLAAAAGGKLDTVVGTLSLGASEAIDWYSEAPHNSMWFSPLQLRVSARTTESPIHPQELALCNDELRRATIPFDGLPDLTSQLGLRGDLSGSTAPRIEIAISPPVDLNVNACSLEDNRFHGTILAHENFDLQLIGFAIRAAPDPSTKGRKQIANAIVWGPPDDGVRTGTLSIELSNADSVLAMLSIDGKTVRRQWVLDLLKAPNPRYVSQILFDPDFKMLRRHLFETSEARKFEVAVAALLFMLGFSVGLPAETDAPDILVTTPNGESLIVECTIKTSDFAAKLGKVIERRAALSKTLAAANLPSNVMAAVVCRLPRDEMSATTKDLSDHNVLLFTLEHLEAVLSRIRYVQDPTALLQEAIGTPSLVGIGD